ncbi:hypothetical protein DTO164E3_8299 [Paecilomyces variotii]|nr:hypothetical protein DTO164E3_8299 [Paecilomyces variotii]KAJ9321098.1 hypothetical protein DTO027B3_7854 [Paecilomyces variotii]KAJ9327919.1 hypothetical protein DTO027B5_8885 [Paecilomyces variotii]KAJ9365190.1 hypothetical protein DTO280E4_845 [Paecilomyces variotii]KAJ9386331.1 hypothetical protein DTO063F5_3845 [Paecilomyces variotii]
MPRSPKVLSSRYTSLTVQTGCTSSVLIGALPLRERKRPEYHRSCGAALRTTRLRMSIERIFFKTYAG